MGSQNVLEVNEPVLIVRHDDGPIGPKHVALYVLLMVIIDVLDENINTLFNEWKVRGRGIQVITVNLSYPSRHGNQVRGRSDRTITLNNKTYQELMSTAS